MPLTKEQKEQQEKNKEDFKQALDVQLGQIREYVLDSMEDGIMNREWAPLDAIVTALQMSGAIKKD